MAISQSDVAQFFDDFEQAQNSHDFDLVIPLLHEDVVFRFNDGDFRGIDAARTAFENTWAHDVSEERYWMTDLVVESRDEHSVLVTFRYHWAGTTADGTFEVGGRGSALLVSEPGRLRLRLEHLSG